jgi:hypothetical protein
MLSLSDDELAQIMSACQPHAPDRRSAFLRQVADTLQGCPVIGPGAVYRAVAQAQREHFDPPQLGSGSSGPMHLGKRPR